MLPRTFTNIIMKKTTMEKLERAGITLSDLLHYTPMNIWENVADLTPSDLGNITIEIHKLKKERTVTSPDIIVCRGDIFYADLDPVMGAEQGGLRPVIILQSDATNMGNSVIIAPLTSTVRGAATPAHVIIGNNEIGKSSIIKVEQLRAIDKSRLQSFVRHADDDILHRIDLALKIVLDYQ